MKARLTQRMRDMGRLLLVMLSLLGGEAALPATAPSAGNCRLTPNH
jgi:hypothetical protein